MAKSFGRQQPYQPPAQAPEPAPAPVPVPAPPMFPSEHAKKSFEARETQHYLEVSAAAAQQAAHAEALGTRINGLVLANRDAEEQIRQLGEAIQARREQIDQLAAEKTDNELYAKNNFDDARGTAALLTFHGFRVPTPQPAPSSDVLVASSLAVAEPSGNQAPPEPCPCGDQMRWTADHGFVHDVPGGWEAAGELCKRRREQTQAMPVDDVVVGS